MWRIFLKVQVIDVVSRDRCVCETEEGKLLEGGLLSRFCMLLFLLSLLRGDQYKVRKNLRAVLFDQRKLHVKELWRSLS